jgi:uncharacterized protein
LHFLSHKLLDEELWLLPQKVLFWPLKKILVVADLHAGKSAHFRKHGIPIPSVVFDKDLQILSSLIQQLKPDKIVFLGDMIHSVYNKELDVFDAWMRAYPVEFILIKGNHDKASISFLEKLPLNIYDERLLLEPFVFSHDLLADPERYNITGHIHPAVLLKGKARQSLRLECFYFTPKYAVLPAFGRFTGTSIIENSKTDNVFVVLDDKVVAI